jgi:cytochrome c-type biogenesis protein CcmH
MILFWLICATLVAIALAFVLPPLLQRPGKDTSEQDKREANLDVYRDQLSELDADLKNGIIGAEQHKQDRNEIERRLLDDEPPAETGLKKESKKQLKQVAAARGPVYAIALGIPIIAIALYLRVGNSAALSETATAPPPFAAGSQDSGQMTQQRVEANVAALAKRLEQNPGDADGWVMLGRSYTAQEKYSEASNAYAKASALKPNDADLLADYAFIMAMANGRQLRGQPFDLIKKALQLDPQNAKALELAGSAEFEAGNYQQAIAYWQKVAAMTPADSELGRTLSERINDAKAKASPGAK